MELSYIPSAVIAKTWIECEFIAKAINLSMKLSRKRKLSQKPICYKCSPRLWKKNDPARRLVRILSENILGLD